MKVGVFSVSYVGIQTPSLTAFGLRFSSPPHLLPHPFSFPLNHWSRCWGRAVSHSDHSPASVAFMFWPGAG